jgi:hypothetical protein
MNLFEEILQNGWVIIHSLWGFSFNNPVFWLMVKPDK